MGGRVGGRYAEKAGEWRGEWREVEWWSLWELQSGRRDSEIDEAFPKMAGAVSFEALTWELWGL